MITGSRHLLGSIPVIVAALLSPAIAVAHHSFAMFDRTKEVEIEGTVREFQWTSPHVWIQVIAVENGKEVEYGVEGNSPLVLAHRGWNHSSFKPGDKVKLRINPLRSGGNGGSLVSATFADGRVLKDLRSNETAASPSPEGGLSNARK